MLRQKDIHAYVLKCVNTETLTGTNQIHVRRSGVDVKGLVVARAGGQQKAEPCWWCVSGVTPVCAHHVSDSADLSACHVSVFTERA